MLTDDELDEYVSSLLTSQAKRQSIAYSTLGFRAFLKNAGKEGPVGKPNTRFLNNVVKNVDGFNAALARKEEKESRERLKELKRRDGEKMHGYKAEERRSPRSAEEDWKIRRRRERSRSPTPRRRDESKLRERRRRHRLDYSSHEESTSRRGRLSERRARVDKSDDDQPSRSYRDKRVHEDLAIERKRRRHHEKTDGESCLRHSHHRTERNTEERRSRHTVSDDDTTERRRREFHRNHRHSTREASRTRRHRHRHLDREESLRESSSSAKVENNHTPCPKSKSPSPESQRSPFGPTEPIQGPEYLLSKGRGRMNGGTLDAKFASSYDPRKDVVDQHDDLGDDMADGEDDWGVALRALRAREIYVLSGAMTERLSETQMQSQSTGWPTYSKGEREWDKGKVLLDDGSIGTKAWGDSKKI
jgi:hypothetical protein